MPKSLNDILKGVKKSTVTTLTTGENPGVDYADKMKDTRDFVAQHSVEKHADRVGNEDDVYAASKIKKAEMKRHGHEPKPKDIKVYNKNQQVGQPENVKEEVVDEDWDSNAATWSKKFADNARFAKSQSKAKHLYAEINPNYKKEKEKEAKRYSKKSKNAAKKAVTGMDEEFELEEAKAKAPEIGSYHKVDTEGSHGKHVVTNVADGVVYHQNIKTKEKHRTRVSEWANASSPIKEAKMCESCGKSPCQCDSDDEPRYNGKKDKSGKRKLLTDKKLQEMAKSQNQAVAARIALKHKREGSMPPKGTASHSMMGMSEKQLKDYTKAEKGAPEKVDEALSDQRSSKPTSSDKAREKIFAAMQKKKEEKMKEEAAATETPITFPATNSREGFRV